MRKAKEFADTLRNLARFSQYSESRAAFARAADLIDQLLRENQQLRDKADHEKLAAETQSFAS